MRLIDGNFFVIDNGNYIVNLHLGVPVDIVDVKQKVNNIVDVLKTGQFLRMCNRIIAGTNNGAKIIESGDDFAE